MSFTETLTADGQTNEFVAVSNMRIHLAGTFGSGAVVLQEKQPDGSFDTVVDSSKTADSDYIFESLNDNSGVYRFDLSGSTTPSILIVVRGNVRPVRADV